jgi:hypothetical protein
MPQEAFDALMARGGIALDPASRASILVASALLAALTERLHRPLPVEMEPATIFVPRSGGE